MFRTAGLRLAFSVLHDVVFTFLKGGGALVQFLTEARFVGDVALLKVSCKVAIREHPCGILESTSIGVHGEDHAVEHVTWFNGFTADSAAQVKATIAVLHTTFEATSLLFQVALHYVSSITDISSTNVRSSIDFWVAVRSINKSKHVEC